MSNNEEYTAALLILDRSGSMSSIKHATEASLGQLVKEQANLPGRITFDVVRFDSEFEYVQRFASPQETNIWIDPRGQTALYDAIVRGCQEFARSIETLPYPDRPRFVQVVVATDGQENASKHADALLVRDTMEYHRATYGWDFTFVGSDDAAIADAARLGFEGKKTMKFANSASGVAGMSTGLSDYLAATRRGEDAGYTDAARSAAAH